MATVPDEAAGFADLVGRRWRQGRTRAPVGLGVTAAKRPR